jgi:septum formation protein
MRKIILASTSPRRKQILQITGLKFTQIASNYEEDMTLKMKPAALAMHLSRGKAESVSRKYKNALIIAADTFVVLGNKVLGKPHTNERAREMLKMLSGKTHTLITGLCIIDSRTGKIISKAETTKIYFQKLSETEIKNYIASKEPLDKAGAYAIQGLGSLFIKKIDGDYYNALGLPLFSLAKELKKFGISIL